MAAHNVKLKNFIDRNAYLFWYTPHVRKQQVSDELILEQVLNYADLPTIKEFFNIIGLPRAKEIFNSLDGRRKKNIYPEIYNLFSEYFKRNA